jgi:hypothetical protein
MKRLTVIPVLCFCAAAIGAAGSPFEKLRDAVEARISDIAGSADKAERAEWKGLTKGFEYVVEADALAVTLPGPPALEDLPLLLDVGGLLSKAMSNLAKSGTEDAGIMTHLGDVATWFHGFENWLAGRLAASSAVLPPKDQAKIATATAQAGAIVQDGDDLWVAGDPKGAAKAWLKAVKSLARLYQKYGDVTL